MTIPAPTPPAPLPHWSSTEISRKAWMSVRDADLAEAILLRMASLKDGAPLAVLEWGCGRSTLWYGQVLDTFAIPHSWLGVEHNRDYFQAEIADRFLRAPQTRVVPADNRLGAPAPAALDQGRTVALFDFGPIAPFDSGRPEDRTVDMDAYVDLPARWKYRCDIAIVDGRKRRRCALAARALLKPDGFVLLHDAWRTPYQSAFSAFAFHRRLGDEWWIGANQPLDLDNLLPPHADPR